MKRAILLWAACLSLAQAKDITGTWVAKMPTPMGDMEIVYYLKANNGTISGYQSMAFMDAPIVRGKVEGDKFEFTVSIDLFGKVQEIPVKGVVKGDTLELIPAIPDFPDAPPGGPGGPPPEGMDRPGPLPEGADRPKPPRRMLEPTTIIARRGQPSRPAPVDYANLPKLELPAVVDLPDNGLARTPPMGWNSWNKFHTNISDKMVREIADVMVASGMKDAGYLYINIDDGWQGKRDAGGKLQPNANFPDMKALSDYVHSKGLKLGIYSSPGPRTCAGFEGSYGHEEIDARSWADWGIDYLKYDWCSAMRVWKETDMRPVYQRMGTALRKTGRPIVFSLCQYGMAKVQEWGPKVGGNSWRTTGDISDHWNSMERIGFAQTDLAPYSGPGRWNDPDMLEVGNGGMTPTEYRTHFSLWAMIASPLLTGNDLRNMSEDTRSILMNKEVIAINQDTLGRGGERVAAAGKTEVWKKPLAGGDVAVGLFNRGPAEAEVSVNWADLGLSGERSVRDLWEHAAKGKHATGYSAKVPSHGVVLLRVGK
jgi:alpha-galactosidase